MAESDRKIQIEASKNEHDLLLTLRQIAKAITRHNVAVEIEFNVETKQYKIRQANILVVNVLALARQDVS